MNALQGNKLQPCFYSFFAGVNSILDFQLLYYKPFSYLYDIHMAKKKYVCSQVPWQLCVGCHLWYQR